VDYINIDLQLARDSLEKALQAALGFRRVSGQKRLSKGLGPSPFENRLEGAGPLPSKLKELH